MAKFLLSRAYTYVPDFMIPKPVWAEYPIGQDEFMGVLHLLLPPPKKLQN